MKKYLLLLSMFLAVPAQAAERIISVGGGITEILYALDKSSELVGVDTTSYYPHEVNALPKVGYMRMLSAEGILSLKPTQVIATGESGPETVFTQLKDAGVKVNVIPGELTIEGTASKIRHLAKITGTEAKGEELATKLLEEVKVIKAELAKAKTDKKAKARKVKSVLFIMQHGKSAPMVAGADTAVEGIINLAGGKNAATGFKGFRPLNPEAILLANPDVVILSGSAFKDDETKLQFMQSQGIAATNAARKENVVVMDTLLMTSFGLRTPQTVRELSQYLASTK